MRVMYYGLMFDNFGMMGRVIGTDGYGTDTSDGMDGI